MDAKQQFHFKKGFLPWLIYCVNVLGNSGWKLVDENIKEYKGKFSTSPADADDDLLKAEKLGWIVRGKCEPTPSQLAFLGLQGFKSKNIPDIYASCWFWMPVDSSKPEFKQMLSWIKGNITNDNEIFMHDSKS